MPETIRAHGVEVTELTLTSTGGVKHGVLGQLVDATFNMSLFNKAIFGTITLADGVGAHYLLPIIGEEKLKIVFRSAGRAIKEFEGRVIGMRDIQYDDTYQMLQYTLDFVSELGFQNLVAPKVSHYTDANPLDAVYDITENFLQSDKFVETFDGQYAKNVEIIYPKVDPFQAIDMIVSRTYEGRGNRSSLFMFFEELDALKFVNIESLFQQESIPDYYFDMFETETSKTRDKEFYRIIDVTYDQKFNTEHKIAEGMLDSEVIRFNPITKQIQNVKTRYRTLAPNFESLDGSSFINTNTSDFLSQHEFKDEQSKDVGRTSAVSYKVLGEFDSYVYKTLSYGKSKGMFESLFQTMMEITVPGHTGRKPGDIINIPAMPRGTSFSDGTNREEYMQGKFIVTGVKHVFNQGEITTILNLSKPSFAKQIESVEI